MKTYLACLNSHCPLDVYCTIEQRGNLFEITCIICTNAKNVPLTESLRSVTLGLQKTTERRLQGNVNLEETILITCDKCSNFKNTTQVP